MKKPSFLRRPRGFPHYGHYTAMKRRGLLPEQRINDSRDSKSQFNKKSEKYISWLGWVIIVFLLSGLLKLCGLN